MKNLLRELINLDSNDAESIKRRQSLIFVVIVICFFMISAFVVLSTGNKPVQITKGTNKITLSKPSQNITAEDRWLSISERKMLELETTNQNLMEKIANLEEIITKNQQNDKTDIINQILADIEHLKTNDYQHNTNDINNPMYTARSSQVKLLELKLANDSKASDPVDDDRDLIDYLPAGSYAPAQMISGVDASVGMSSQSDPRPVLFRITGPAITSEYNGIKQTIDKVVGCTVTGAASGDLSSEKVFVRLLKMTCSFKKGKVVERDVQGYVVAVGKAGIRGPVISREGDLLVKSFFAGAVSGFGKAGSNALQPRLEINSGIATEQIKTRDIVGQGLGEGISTSADKLSDYMIKRAEQYQPVISIQAGIPVEIVFSNGIWLERQETSKPMTTQPLSNPASTYSNSNINNLGF